MKHSEEHGSVILSVAYIPHSTVTKLNCRVSGIIYFIEPSQLKAIAAVAQRYCRIQNTSPHTKHLFILSIRLSVLLSYHCLSFSNHSGPLLLTPQQEVSVQLLS